MTVDIEQVRRDTTEVMSGIDGWSPEYVTQDLLSDLESAEEVAEQPVLEDDLQTLAYIYYGNRPVWIRDLSRPGFVGRLVIYNGSTNRPNDPCGTRFRRSIWFYRTPRGTPYRNCGRFWGYQFINA